MAETPAVDSRISIRRKVLALAFALACAGIALAPAGAADSTSSRIEAERTHRGVREFLESGPSFFLRFFEFGWPTTDEFRSIATVDSYAFAGDTLEAMVLYSGVGVALEDTEYFEHRYAEAKKADPAKIVDHQAYLDARLERFAKLAGYDSPLAKGFSPIAIEFSECDPSYRDAVDPAKPKTRRWDPAKSVPTTTPGAIGLSIYDSTLFARETLSKDRNDIVFGQDRSFMGTNARDGFLALVLLESAIAKLETLRHQLIYDHKKQKLVPQARLYAGQVGVEAFPPHFIGISLPDRNDAEGKVIYEAKTQGAAGVLSHLSDSAALLLAATELWELADPSGDYGRLFAGGKRGKSGDEVFPAETQQWAQDLILYEFERLAHVHLHPRKYLLHSVGVPGKQPTATLRMADVALVMLALENAHDKLAGAAKILAKKVEESEKYAQRTGNFLASVQAENGSFYDSYDIEANQLESKEQSLATQGDAIRALVAAHRITGDGKYIDVAMKTLRYLEAEHWDPRAGVYLSAPKSAESKKDYTLDDVASILGALRELAIETKNVRILYRYQTNFVGFKPGLMHSETARGAEESTDSDSDGDGIFGVATPAAGAKNGIAPVLKSGIRAR